MAYGLSAAPDGSAVFSTSALDYFTTNFGVDWRPPPPNFYPTVSPASRPIQVSKDLVYAFFNGRPACCFVYAQAGTVLKKSVDGGRSWQAISSWPPVHYLPPRGG